MAARPNIELSGRLNFYERRRDSSPPPSIEFVFYGILAGFILAACAIAYYIARLLKKRARCKTELSKAPILGLARARVINAHTRSVGFSSCLGYCRNCHGYDLNQTLEHW